MRIALVLSLMINAFLAFAVASGMLLHKEKFDGPPHQGGMYQPEDIFSPRSLESLPEEYREVMRREIMKQLPRARAIHEDVRVQRDAMLDMLAAPEFDEAAFREAGREMKALQDEGLAMMADTVIDVIASLPAEERIALAERLQARREELRENFRKRFGDGPMGGPDGPMGKPGGPPPPGDGFGRPRPDGPPPGEMPDGPEQD